MPCIHKWLHTDLQRQMNPESRTMLPKMAFTGFASRYRAPTADEGFEDITKVDFKVRFAFIAFICRGVRWGSEILEPRLRACSSLESSLTFHLIV